MTMDGRSTRGVSQQTGDSSTFVQATYERLEYVIIPRHRHPFSVAFWRRSTSAGAYCTWLSAGRIGREQARQRVSQRGHRNDRNVVALRPPGNFPKRRRRWKKYRQRKAYRRVSNDSAFRAHGIYGRPDARTCWNDACKYIFMSYQRKQADYLKPIEEVTRDSRALIPRASACRIGVTVDATTTDYSRVV